MLKQETNCPDFLCPTKPECKAKRTYKSPCIFGTPLSDEEGNAITCSNNQTCPYNYACTVVPEAGQSVCCAIPSTVIKKLSSKFSKDMIA